MAEDDDDREIIDEFEEESATEETTERVLDNSDSADNNSNIVPNKLMYPEADPEQSNSSADPDTSQSSDQASDNVRYLRKRRQLETFSLPLNDSLQDDVDLIKRSLASDHKNMSGDKDSTTSDVMEIKPAPQPIR